MTPYEELRKSVKDRRMLTEGAGDAVASSTPEAVETGIGLGDLVEKGLQLIGIKAKPSCGCAKRKKFLNDLI